MTSVQQCVHLCVCVSFFDRLCALLLVLDVLNFYFIHDVRVFGSLQNNLALATYLLSRCMHDNSVSYTFLQF